MDEVRAILNVALGNQEKKLRLEYDQVLQRQLLEQFESFSRFNQEYVSRQMSRDENCDYIS